MDRSLLARATDGSDAPTPGFLYLDIAKNASSSPHACSEIATYLSRRLASKNNHNIKFKCLKVISKVSESPVTRGQFKRAVSQDPSAVGAIKEALQFRGPPDPARGDEIYARVRTAAKEALDAIYSDTPSSEYSGGGSGGIGRGIASSYSPSPYAGGGGGAPSSGPGRMQGIGNPMYPDPRLQAEQGIGNMTIGEVVSVVGETIVEMVKDPLARNVDVGPPPRNSSMPGYGSGGAYSNPPPGRNQLTQATGGQWTMASNRGPSAVVPPQNYNSERDEAYFKARDAGSNAFQWAQQQPGGGHGGVGGSWGSAATGVTINTSMPSVASQARQPTFGASPPPAHAPPTGTGGRAASDGSYERNLIMELCPPGGMKAEPPPDKLASFATAVPSLDSDLVCPALLDCLEDGQPWVIRAKALCVIDTVLRVEEENQVDGGTNPYADFFFTCRGEIEPLASHPRMAIKEPAKRVLRALGLESESGAPPPRAGFKPPPGHAVAASRAAEPPNLLDFDDEPAPPSAPSPAVAPHTQPSADSLFGGLTTKDTPAPPLVPPPPPPPTAASSETFLGDMTPGTPLAPSGGNLFDDMTVKEKPTSIQAMDVAPANGSAFGFINGSPAPPQSKEPETTTSPAPMESFDPLLSLGNVSPNTAKASMGSLTPAQMQAMAYQQMMMQQQMQMAYAMQQQQMGRPMMPAGMMMQQGGPHRSIMKNNSGAAASSPFSFMDAPAPKKDDKKFDFVKDAMKDEGTKK